MKTLKKQNGLTMWGWLVVLCMVGFIGMQFFTLIEPVINYKTLEKIVTDLGEDTTLKAKGKRGIIDKIQKRAQLDLRSFKVDKNSVKVEKIKGGKMRVTVFWEQRTDFIWDLDFVLTFDKSVEVK